MLLLVTIKRVSGKTLAISNLMKGPILRVEGLGTFRSRSPFLLLHPRVHASCPALPWGNPAALSWLKDVTQPE